MIRPAPPTAAELIEEEELAKEEDREEDEEAEEGPECQAGLPMSKVKEVIDLGIKLRHLLEQDSTINSEARCSFLTKALVGYDYVSRTRKQSAATPDYRFFAPTHRHSTSTRTFNSASSTTFHCFHLQ